MGKESYEILKEAWDDYTYFVNEIEVNDQAGDLMLKHRQLEEFHQQAEKAVKMGDFKMAEHYRMKSKNLAELINKVTTPDPPKVADSIDKGIELSKKGKGADDAMRRLNERHALDQMNRMFSSIGSAAKKAGETLAAEGFKKAAEGTITSMVAIAGTAGILSLATSKPAQAAQQPKPDTQMNQYFNYLANWVIYAIKEILSNGGNAKAIRRVKLFGEWFKNPAV